MRNTILRLLCLALLATQVHANSETGIDHDEDKLALLERYAPEIWLAQGERYFPSSVEWAFPYLKRVKRDGKFWLTTKQKPDSPSDGDLPVFRGDLETAPVYAFWVSGKEDGATDLVYFTYYPYNRGKELLNTMWGNHVGDWENMVVRLDRNLEPQTVFMSQHSGDGIVPWDAIEKNESGHPVVYSAWGSHGLWETTGDHVYKETPIGDLSDVASKGSPWKTWERVVAFDFQDKRGIAGNEWPRWMDSDYTVATTKNPGSKDPASGAIYRWGNAKRGCGGKLEIYEKTAGECRLNNGPTGPIDKKHRW